MLGAMAKVPQFCITPMFRSAISPFSETKVTATKQIHCPIKSSLDKAMGRSYCSTRCTLKGLGRIPLIAAPMAGGPSTPNLVIAAAQAGAVGFLAAGYLSSEAMAHQIQAVRAAQVRYGLNLFLPSPAVDDPKAVIAYRESLRPDADRFGVQLPEPRLGAEDDDISAKIEFILANPHLRPDLVSFTFGVPEAGVVKALQKLGSTVLGTVTSNEEAVVTAATGVDGLVVQHSNAGGHSGAFIEPALTDSTVSLPELIAQVHDSVKLPVIAAGGIATAEDCAQVLKAGACAAQLGTAFLLVDEAGTKTAHRTALETNRFSKTERTRAFSGKWARGLANRFMRDHQDAPDGYPAIHFLTSGIRSAAAQAGDAEAMNLWAGTGFRKIRSGSTASIITSLWPH